MTIWPARYPSGTSDDAADGDGAVAADAPPRAHGEGGAELLLGDGHFLAFGEAGRGRTSEEPGMRAT